MKIEITERHLDEIEARFSGNHHLSDQVEDDIIWLIRTVRLFLSKDNSHHSPGCSYWKQDWKREWVESDCTCIKTGD